MMKLFLLLIVFVLSSVSCSELSEEPLVIVVGHVDATSARVLIDRGPGPAGNLLVGSRGKARLPDATEIEFTIGASPRVLQLNNLFPNTNHVVKIRVRDVLDTEVSFKTVAPLSDGFLVASCNRVLEDRDVTTLKEISKLKNQENPTAMVHLGDQVYCDYVPKLALKQEDVRYEWIVEQFRECYRKTWGIGIMQSILRSGANWMLPDDHEVINNVSPEMLNDPVKSLIIKAGMQVFKEYQFSLLRDPQDDASWNPFYSFPLENKNVKGQLLDLRFERVANFNSRHPLVAKDQWKYLDKALISQEKVYVFSNLPLLFIPTTLTHIAYWFEKDTMASYPTVLRDTLDVLNHFCDVGKEVTIFAGDVHLYADSLLTREDCKIRQVITSGISKGSTAIRAPHLFLYDLISLQIWSRKFAGGWYAVYNEIFLAESFVFVHANGTVQPFLMKQGLTAQLEAVAFVFEHFSIIAAVGICIILLNIIRRICATSPRKKQAGKQKEKTS
jgi:hypothetical protein